MKQEKDKQLNFECQQAFLRHYHNSPNPDEEWKRFQQHMLPGTKSNKPLKKSHHSFHWIYLISGAACFILAIGITFLLLQQQKQNSVIIVAEKEGHITLDGISITDYICKSDTSASHQINLEHSQINFSNTTNTSAKTRTITTPRSKTFNIILNDGTEVLMNAESKLTFPETFADTCRKVYLEGEAYFKVAHNKSKPFYVTTDHFSTKVLGTEFNILSYENSISHVTLISGSVSVNIPDIQQNVLLTPGQDLMFKDDCVKVNMVDTNEFIQWKNGYFYFDNMPLTEILYELGRWYNITVEITQENIRQIKCHFIADRNAGIEDIVYNLNEFNQISAVLINNKLIVSQKK